MNEEIPIIIVNHNDSEWLDNCLNSIFLMNSECEKNELMAHIILLDNASSDNSFKIINKYEQKSKVNEYQNIKMTSIWESENVGFIRSNNKGIKIGLTNPDVKFVATLNPDTQVCKQWLTKLYEKSSEYIVSDKYGMYASAINVLIKKGGDYIASDEKYNYGHSYYNDGSCYDIGYKDNNFKKTTPDQMFCHCHAGAMLSRKMLEESGLSDIDYWSWYDCPNLGWKSRLNGWKPVLAKDAKMWHRLSDSRKRPEFKKIVERNRVLTILRFMPIEKQSLALSLYKNQSRKDGTSYNERLEAISNAHKLLGHQYNANDDIREKTYEKYCLIK